MSTAIIQAGPAVRPARPALRVVPALAPVAPVTRPAPPLRLTPRGRLVVRSLVVLLGLLVTAAVVLGAGRSAKADADAHPVEIGYHVVLPGETLWQIAGEVAPRADRRDTVARIVELNALGSEALAAGDRIAVPVRG